MPAFIHTIRTIFIPQGSYLERILRFCLRGYRVFRREGFSGVLQRLRRRPQVLAPFLLRAIPGQMVSLPAISVVYLRSNQDVALEAVEAWLERQTLPGELIIWSQKDGSIERSGPSKRITGVKKYSDLRQHLSGKYICFASQDLIAQPATYLETNLLALETEGLGFTLTINGRDDQIQKKLEAGCIPTHPAAPLFRLVARKELVNDQLTLDPECLLAFLGRAGKDVIGKVLFQTRAALDAIQAFQYQPVLSALKISLFEQHIMLQKTEANWLDFPFDTHPVPSVVPVIENPGDLYTVLVIMPVLAVGGAERVALDMMRYLCKEMRFIVVTLENHDPSIGTTVEAFRAITPYVYTARDFLMPHLTYSFMEYLLAKFDVKTLYIANGANWVYDALTSLRAQFPHLRMVDQVYDHEAGWINRYDPVIANCFDANIGVNQKICQAYIARGVPPEHAIQLENGIDLDEYDPALYPPDRVEALKDALAIPRDKRVVTFMARVAPQKRPLDFVDLARKCSSDPSLVFLMVGDGPLGTAVNQEINRAGLSNIIRKPFYKPSSDIFAVSDVYVLPSEYEGMPMVLLEAQAMGKPVVVTDAGNNQDVLSKTGGGVVVPVGSVPELRDGIYKMLQNGPDPIELRQKVSRYYSLSKMASDYRRVLLGR